MGRRRIIMVCTLAVALLAIIGGMAAFNPRVATHFGYALPGDGGLPSRITYASRDYAANGWCLTPAQLQAKGWWPLHEVAQIPTLMGAPHPLYTDAYPNGFATTTMMLFVPRGPCYAPYVIEGGP